MTPRVTVAVCTWNRSASLARTLEGMTRLSRPEGVEWELLVVDNNSTDDTRAVVSSFETRLPLRSAFEPEPGLSNARNRAVREARGEYIVWTDDDVTVSEGWLAAYLGAFGRWPDAAVFGGPIVPRFEGGGPPQWLRRGLPWIGSAYGVRDLGDLPVRLSRNDDRLPYGANYAVRTREQRRHPYDPDLGRAPGSTWTGGEEIQVVAAILAEGAEGWWVPEAAVRHRVPRSDQTVGHLRRYYVAQGRAAVRLDPPPAGKRLLGRPRWLWRQALTAELIYRWRRVVSPPDRWVRDLKRAGLAWGRLLEA